MKKMKKMSSPRLHRCTTGEISHSPFTLANFSIVNLVFIFRCSSTTTNPVCERRVNLLVYSLSLHRHSCIGFILSFASSIHNNNEVYKKYTLITLGNFSSINLVSIFRYSSSSRNPVYLRHVNSSHLGSSLSSHGLRVHADYC